MGTNGSPRRRLLWLAIAALVAWVAWGNRSVGVTRYEIGSYGLPAGTDRYRIVQISDLHNAELGHGNDVIVDKVDAEAPDAIFVTGDLIDAHRTDVGVALSLTGRLAMIAPIYCVTGNHERWCRREDYGRLLAGLGDQGVKVLHNSVATVDGLSVVGLDDPSFDTADPTVPSAASLGLALDGIDSPRGYTILLSHRPEAFGTYAGHGYDLVLSGHAHGGQVRLPLIGGLFAPDQGLFPKYDWGLYTRGQTSMIVSRGIGNSTFPFRVNDNPEIVTVDLVRR